MTDVKQPDISQLDPLFRTQPGQAATDEPTDSGLGALDPIFANPIGPSTSAATAATTTAAANKDKGSVFGLSKNEERGIAAVTGAAIGPTAQKMATAAFPSKETRLQQAAEKIEKERKLQQTMQALRDEELLKRGITPQSAAASTVADDLLLKPKTSGAINWTNAMTSDMPEALASQAENMRKNNPQGGQAIIDRNTLARQKVADMGHSNYQLGRTPGGVQLALPPNVTSDLEKQAAAKTAQATQQAEAAAAAKMAQATPGPLSRAGAMLKAPFTTGALGGAGAGLSFYEAYNRYMKGDHSGAVIAALGGAGALMTMVPGFQAPGLAIGLGSIPLQYANDYLKGNSGQQPAPTPIATPVGR